MESQDLTIIVGGVQLLQSANAAVVFYNLNGRNFAGEENRDKSYSQHLLSLDFLFNGAERRISLAPGTSLQLLGQDGAIREESTIAHHANLAAMPVELILPQAAGVEDDPDGWALFIADAPLSGHFTAKSGDDRYRAGVRWAHPDTEDFLLFNAATEGARQQVACTRGEVARMCLQGREGSDDLLAMPTKALWEAISEEREKIASLTYGEVVALLMKARNRLKKAA